MAESKKKILILVEGAKTDVAVMEKLFQVYPELDAKYQIVSYDTNIYVLWQEFFQSGEDRDSLDILQVMKAREADPSRKRIFDDRYTDIMLVFDLDPQDPNFKNEKILQMQEYFCESSNMGKLYLNYPMIEAFYHMNTIPDPDFITRMVTMRELKGKLYKSRVNSESYRRDYRKFIQSRSECNLVILDNIDKALHLLGKRRASQTAWTEVDLLRLLVTQLECLSNDYLHVLCTCATYIYDYNHTLLFENN